MISIVAKYRFIPWESLPSFFEAVDVDGWKLEKSQMELVEETEEDLKDAGCNLFPVQDLVLQCFLTTIWKSYPGISLL